MTEPSATAATESKSDSSSAKSTQRRSLTSVETKRSELVTDDGRTSIADTVVAKIAGLACREVSGVHDMGSGMARTFGSIKDMFPVGSSEPSPTRGVSV